MTQYYSVATGDWSSSAVWSLSSGGAGGAGVPGTGDKAYVEGGYTITISSPIQINKIEVDGATLAISANITYDDASDQYFTIKATANSNITNGGTRLVPIVIQSVSASPTYYILPQIYDSTNTRSINLKYLEFKRSAWFLGDDYYRLWFNFPGNATYTGAITNVTPLYRPPRLDYHRIRGRDTGRTYHDGSDSGTVGIEGYVRWANHTYTDFLNDKLDSGSSLGLITEYVHVPRGYIESLRWRPKSGSPYLYFSATIVEDPI